jgi:hypothetical protein
VLCKTRKEHISNIFKFGDFPENSHEFKVQGKTDSLGSHNPVTVDFDFLVHNTVAFGEYSPKFRRKVVQTFLIKLFIIIISIIFIIISLYYIT